MKRCLRDAPSLSPLVPDEELYLYVAASTTATSSALVRDAKGVLKPVYFVSNVYADAETRYADIEKIALALVRASQKMWPYFQAHRIVVLTQHPLRQMLSHPLGSPRTIRWALELAEYDIVYRSRTAIKAQVLVDFLADFVPLAPSDEEWTLYVDGSSSSQGAGAGVILKSPTEIVAQHVVELLFTATNNEAEYEALLFGL